jgi:glycogen synthase
VRIALVSRELYPYIGGGIAPIVAAQARALSKMAEVVVVTSAMHAERDAELRAAGDPRLLPEDVQVVFVQEPGPDGFGAFYSHMHAYSARVHRALRGHYGDRGPDLIEFPDYLAEGFVTIQASHTGAPWLRDTLVCVRLHTTAGIVSVLNGHVADDLETEATLEAERYCLRRADRVLWSGGDVLETYHRFYGADALAQPVKLADGFLADEIHADPGRVGGPPAGGPVRLLYVGRMERRKGVQNLLRAVTALARDDWRLTLLGGDTQTAPLQSSMRVQLELMAAADERITFADPVPRHDVARFVREHDLVVVPSLWECWPNSAREALALNRPVLGTPVGGLTEMVQERSGWLARDTTVAALVEALAERLDDPDAITDLIAAGGPREVFEELTDPDLLLERYQQLLAEPRPRAVCAARRTPLVSIVVPYYRLEEFIEPTLDSIAEQTYSNIETIVVNDGSFRDQDRVLERVARRPRTTVLAQVNAGLGAARNFGISQARGEYVVPLDADDVVDPSFVSRCVDVLESDPELAYVGTWVVYMDGEGNDLVDDDGGYTPYGNWSTLIRRVNVAGVCTTLFRRAVFDAGFRYSHDLTSYEDWLLHRQLHDAGLFGAIIPERLFHYRIRERSMMRETGRPQLKLLLGEIRALHREGAVRWTWDAPSATSEPARGVPEAVSERNALAQALDELRAANGRLASERFGVPASPGPTRLAILEAEARRAVELEQRLAQEVEIALHNHELFEEARAHLREPAHRAVEAVKYRVERLRRLTAAARSRGDGAG